MKRCPKCRLLYSGANLRFCRYDGAHLVNHTEPVDEATTRLFSTGKLNDRLASLENRRRRKDAPRNSS